MLSLRDALNSGPAAVTQAISGLGGIGKTALAVEYAHEYYDQYEHILFMRAESPSILIAGVRKIAPEIGLSFTDADDDSYVTNAFRQKLNSIAASDARQTPYLLIVDNADFGSLLTPQALKPFLPDRPTGHVLLTTRAQQMERGLNIRPGSVVRLGTLEPESAIQLLTEQSVADVRLLSADDYAAVTELAEALGYLPLALEHAAAYVAQKEGMTFRLYLNLFRKQSIAHLEKPISEAIDYEKTVATTWQISFDELQKDCPAAADLMRLCAFIAPDEIPIELIVAASTGSVDSIRSFVGGETDVDVLQEKCALLMAALSCYTLVTQNTDVHTFGVHRLVQAVVCWKMTDSEKTIWTDRAINVLYSVFPKVEFHNWRLCERLISHVQFLAKFHEDSVVRGSTTALLLNRAAHYLLERARFNDAEPLFIKALSIRRECLTEDHPDIATSLNNLAGLYDSQHRYGEAEPLYKESLLILRKWLSADHPNIANSLNNLAVLYDSQERYAEAELLYEKALAIRRKSLPVDHPDIATSLNNLAGLYKSQARLEEAELLFKESLLILRKSLLEGHPYIANSLNNLAVLYKAQSRYEEAKPLYQEALSILRLSLGDDHPSTKTVASNYAAFLREADI